jgi:outer membrane protein OmpA-like peptidoglycan-associated protein
MGKRLGYSCSVFLLGGACLTYSQAAAAQTQKRFSLDQFDPAPAGDRFFGVQGGDPGGHVNPRAMLLGEYAYRPLVLYRNDGDDRVASVVSDQLFAHLGIGLGLWQNLSISANLPVALLTAGDSPSSGGLAFKSPSGAALGDLRLGARYRLVGSADGPVQLSLAASLWLPTGNRDKFAGDGSVRGLPAIVLNGETSGFVYALNVGVNLRRDRTFVATKLGTQLSFGGAAGALLAERKLQIGPELYGTTVLDSPFKRDDTNLEGILGVKYRASDWLIGAGAGPGFTRGLGTPTARVVASIAWAPLVEKKPLEPSDRDKDGILDRDDACPDTFGIADKRVAYNGCPDTDADGVFDKEDACVKEPGVRSEDPKLNGCPVEDDRDHDGVKDEDDACVDVPGIRTNDPTTNGCPKDTDGDGVYDKDDACVKIKGVKTDDPETNGCPGDSDGDGIRDDKDACPHEKGKSDPDPEKNGCPQLVRVTNGEITVLQQVQFKTNSDVILPASDALLEEVAGVLREHSEITKIEIQGHTDNRGNPAHNKGLSQRRAQSVQKWLTTKGRIDANRLTARGFGQDVPIDTNDNDEGRQKNRRVQFKIIDTDKPTSVQQ